MKINHLIYIICVGILLAACGTSKKAAKAAVEEPEDKMPPALVVKTKVKVKLKGQKMTTSGTLRMKKGEVIQLSLVDPLLGITELARVELSPERVLVIDRLNRRYMEVPYSDVSFLQSKKIDFEKIQDIFRKKVLTDDGYSLQMKTGGHDVSFSIVPDMGTLRESDNWETHTSVSNRYEKIDPEKLLKSLIK